MSQSLTPPTPPAAGRAFALSELPGLLGKTLETPPDAQGVVIYSGGQARLLPAGRHTVLSAIERLQGKGAGLRAGYVSTRPFNAQLRVPNLLSGDGELLDASLAGLVEVADPARFFTEQVIPQRAVSGSLDISSGSAPEALAVLVRRYLAADLIHGLPTARLLPELQSHLEPALASQGLRLKAIRLITFLRAEDRVAVAQKALALEERLRDLKLQDEMNKIENQTQLDDFIRQVQAEVGLEGGLRPVAETPATPAALAAPAQPRPTLGEMVSNWRKNEAAPQGSGQHWRIADLFRRQAKPSAKEPTPGPRQIRRWMRGRIILLVVLGLVAVCISALVLFIASPAPASSKFEVLLLVWAPFFAALIESIVALFRKREEVAEALWTTAGTTFLDDVTRNNRERADRLVREQCAEDLRQIFTVLNDVRSRVYRAGDEDQALRLKELERKIEQYRQQVLKLEFGKAPYLGDLNITSQVWDHMLDYDEKLLAWMIDAHAAAETIQQQVAAGAPVAELVSGLESKLDHFYNAFASRARALRSQPSDQ